MYAHVHCTTQVLDNVLARTCIEMCSVNTTGLQCVRFSQQQSSTDLHAVACNSGKLNAGTKINIEHTCTSHYPRVPLSSYMHVVIY